MDGLTWRLSRSADSIAPTPLQQKFAVLVERVERLRAVQREALRQAKMRRQRSEFAALRQRFEALTARECQVIYNQ